MSPQLQFAWRGIGLSVGVATLLLGNSVIAAPQYNWIAQVNPTVPPVVVDTEPLPPVPGTTPPNGSTVPSVTTATRFTCQLNNGQYTVMYQPESQPNRFFPWATPTALGGGWSEQRRCEEISRRLESYRPDGLLELTTGVENNYNTVCVITQRNNSSCRIVFTVPPGQDPILTRDRVFENLTVADSGQQTTGVYTYTNRGNELDRLFNLGRSVIGGNNQRSSRSINLRPFLDRADGGNGTQLSGGVPARNNTQSRPGTRRLNPSNF
ncbi:hypothetical protein IQ230_22460 [Gloeocapsopsis crepidinum LEGE 06123]|uniref:Circadian oscillating protein COP23 n=1 Tax=Gloeocapsopsis crepidinum LEGE 06123 TaxID=588587 RepID=A0ABR9UXN2_9CHRO|nr:COP23 domain-containing protein [Gloeocapsopsis crepidinum]MBE9193062.1 hypothetical protein [Gloeocapsopsis crepidinum LEGE 06123]